MAVAGVPLPAASVVPSGLNATEWTGSEFSLSTRIAGIAAAVSMA